MDAETLDLCKENIQPLKQGRKASKLGLALRAQSDAELQAILQEEREQHELAIMTYDGDDPLQPRHDYVHWIEQSCPKHGKEVNLIPLLEDTIMQFKEDDRYKQDTRFIELIVKYIETQDNPIELFQMVYAQGLGTKCATFYKAWADQLDANNDLNRADQVFKMGQTNNAEPKELIDEAHLRFQLSVGRRMMTGQLATEEKPVSSETAERQRKVLGRIKKGGTIRPSSGLPGTVSLLSDHLPQPGNRLKALSVYQEDENGLPIVKSTAKLKVHAESTHKENTLKPTPWNQSHKRRPAPVVPSTPNFQVLEDDDVQETPSQRMTCETPVPANVLRAKKSESKHKAEELFKSSITNSLSKPHLPVIEAFAGGREFCFEELRWAYLTRKTAKKPGEETPVRLNHFTTPCKSSLVSPLPTPPHSSSTSNITSYALITPAPRSRPMYPILESAQPNDEHPDVGRSDPAYSVPPETPIVIHHTDEDGVYAIPSTPAGHMSMLNKQLNGLSTGASTSRMKSEDTPSTSQIIARPKIVKPAKVNPFIVFEDED